MYQGSHARQAQRPQDRGVGVQAFPGRQGVGRRGLHPEYDGRGEVFKEQQRERVLRPKCRNDLAKVSLVTHFQTQHGMAKGGLVSEGG